MRSWSLVRCDLSVVFLREWCLCLDFCPKGASQKSPGQSVRRSRTRRPGERSPILLRPEGAKQIDSRVCSALSGLGIESQFTSPGRATLCPGLMGFAPLGRKFRHIGSFTTDQGQRTNYACGVCQHGRSIRLPTVVCGHAVYVGFGRTWLAALRVPRNGR